MPGPRGVYTRRNGAWVQLGVGDLQPPVDTTPPTIPTNLRITNISETAFTVAWNASTDAVGVVRYEVKLSTGAYVTNNLLLTKTYSGLTAGTDYVFSVRAFDAAGNVSTVATLPIHTSDPVGTALFYGHQPGLTYVGMSVDVPFTQAITEIGHDVDVYRIFDPSQSSKISICYTRATKMIPWVSFNLGHLGVGGGDTAGWNTVASGAENSQINSIADTLLAYVQGANKSPMVVTFCHEPVGPDRTATAGTAYTSAFNRVVDLFKARPTWNDRILFCPNYEEFTFRGGGTPAWASWMNAAFMNRMDFFSFDIYQFAGTNAANAAAVRVARVKAVLQAQGFGNMALGVGECGGRQDTYGYGVDTSRWTSAQYGRQWANYLKSDPQFWITSWYNATDVGNTRLTQPPYIPPDTETYMNVYQDYLAGGARLADIGIV